MGVWVLIFVVKIANAGGPATANFRTLEACEAARDAIIQQYNGKFARNAWAEYFNTTRGHDD